jgi:MGT family glycosyltransferase
MARIGILAIPVPSHLYNCLSIAKELKQRGHQVIFYQVPDSYQMINSAGLECRILGQEKYPLGWLEDKNREFGQLKGVKAVKYGIDNYFYPMAVLNLQEAPTALKEDAIELLIVDQLSSEGGTIADYLKIPYVTLCPGVPYNVEPNLPPPFLLWNYNLSRWAIWRNQIGYFLMGLLTRPLWNLVSSYRRQWNLYPYTNLNDPYSRWAQISQNVKEFELPHTQLPQEFHFVGPCIDPNSLPSVPFPYEKLTDQPLIYASMGTLLNRSLKTFEIIADACSHLDAQLVMSLGHKGQNSDLPKFAGNPIVVNYAPQLELISRASLTITNGGLNTTLHSLNRGVPVIAIPSGNDHPGVAARIVWTGVGESVPLSRLTVERLRKAINQVLTIPSYSENARRLQTAIQNSGGVTYAAQVIENVLAQSPHKFTNS